MPPEHPILFTGPMVRVILSGAKTQTRRVMRPQPPAGAGAIIQVWQRTTGPGGWGQCGVGPRHYDDPPGHTGLWMPLEEDAPRAALDKPIRCSYGVPGDVLWVRETWRTEMTSGFWDIHYRAGGERDPGTDIYKLKNYRKSGWRPSIHMPRWACRLRLRVEAVRVERVQDITPPDCEMEGIEGSTHATPARGQPYDEYRNGDGLVYGEPRQAFAVLWDEINAKPGYSWEANPFVWTVTFKREENANA